MRLPRALTRPDAKGGLFAWLHGFTLHVATGFVAVGVHYGAMWLLVEARLGSVMASAMGFLAGAVARFALSYWHVFAPTRGVRVAGTRFAITIACQLVANSGILAALLAAGVPLWPAQVATTVALTVFNYLAYRLWVFR